MFTPFRVGNLELRNRIIIAPMCQYSADNGSATDWHTIHLGHLALSGRGILTIEATAVSPEGRISPQDLGLWSDENEAALARFSKRSDVTRISRSQSNLPTPAAKRQRATPWEGGKQIPPTAPGGWQTVAPSAVPFAEGENPPRTLDNNDLNNIRQAFAKSAKRTARLNLDAIQRIHCPVSPSAKTEEYGQSPELPDSDPLTIAYR